jgi:hypothetical protein
VPFAAGVDVQSVVCLQVLRKRRGKTLNRRIILKSYLARAADPSLPPGTPDVRQAEGAMRCQLSFAPLAAHVQQNCEVLAVSW